MATLTGIISSGGGIKVGQNLELDPPSFYPTLITFGNEEYLHTGNLKAYSSDYAALKNQVPLMAFVNVDANANILLTNANSTRSWANTFNANIKSTFFSSFSYQQPGHFFKIEKSNTDFLMIQLVGSGAYQLYNYQNVTSNSIVYKYGPNISDLATGNAFGPTITGSTLGLNHKALASGSGFYDSLSYNGRVIVVGGSVAYISSSTIVGDPPVTYYSTTSLNVNGVILQTNTNSFSIFNTSTRNVAVTTAGFETTSIIPYYAQIIGGNTTFANGYAYTAVASNGNHIVVHTRYIAQSNACIVTSTDGTSWTGRTMSGAPANVEIRRTTYSNAGNCYIFITESGNVYTSTDGFTLTQRTTPIIPQSNVVCPAGAGQSCYSATSNSNTFIILSSNTMYQTSNGVLFNRIDMDLVGNLAAAFKSSIADSLYSQSYAQGAANCLSIVWSNNKFIISSPNGRTVYSDDDGATWKIDNIQYNLNTINVEPGYTAFTGTTVHNNSVFCVNRSTGNIIPINVTSALYRTTPDLIGTNENVGGYWIRIK